MLWLCDAVFSIPFFSKWELLWWLFSSYPHHSLLCGFGSEGWSLDHRSLTQTWWIEFPSPRASGLFQGINQVGLQGFLPWWRWGQVVECVLWNEGCQLVFGWQRDELWQRLLFAPILSFSLIVIRLHVLAMGEYTPYPPPNRIKATFFLIFVVIRGCPMTKSWLKNCEKNDM